MLNVRHKQKEEIMTILRRLTLTGLMTIVITLALAGCATTKRDWQQAKENTPRMSA